MKSQLSQFEESLVVVERMPKPGQLHKLSRGDQRPAHTAAKENSMRNRQETNRRIL